MMTPSKTAGIRALPALAAALWILLLPKAPLQAAAITDLRIGSDSEYVRLVLEFDQAVMPAPAYTIAGSRLQITLAGIANALPAGPAAEHPGIRRLDVLPQGGATVIDAVFAFPPADVKAFTLTDPHRFIVDAYRPAPLSAGAGRVDGPAADGAGLGADRPVPGGRALPDASTGHGILERLLAPLIVATSIILIGFVILVWIGGRKRSAEPIRIGPLPPINDPLIDRIDEAVQEHLELNHQIDTLARVARLSHQKSELLAQRLDDVIAALEAGGHKAGGNNGH
jgi:hypothetical protein